MPGEAPHDPQDDRQLARLLASLDEDAAPYQADRALAAQREAARLWQEQADADDIEADDRRPAGKLTKPTRPSPPQEAHRMFALRAALALVIVVVGGVFVTLSNRPVEGQLTLESILNRTADAKTLHLQLSRAGKTADVWIQQPGNVRLDESPGRYQIASGSRLWEIDESANRVEDRANPWLDADASLDLLRLLGLEREASNEFRAVGTSGLVDHAGRSCQVFRIRSNLGKQRVLLEAYADAASGQLYSVAAWKDTSTGGQEPQADRNGPPLAELRLIGRDLPLEESRFVVADSLSEDGRIGKLVDSQGIVVLRPLARQRWTPVARRMVIKPGDWLRTDNRGANAAAIQLTSGSRLTVGPASLIELSSPDSVRLHRGEMEIKPGKGKRSLTLLGPQQQQLEIAAANAGLYRLDATGKLRLIRNKPVWLAGFEGSSNQESIGSLVANIDGNNVPLTIGYHKVKVEIRDQIARTTIEESFVNHTRTALEGVFHFPLPQDASISGFGMWINDELVEADVVEKQRAREIYETILRERRDPALLEWTGGNIFKARVFPIPAHSEKRIRIVYTQALPMRAHRYRYSYAMQSELLQKTPIRELSVEVLVHSALPLKTVHCPTHPVRAQQTEHSARLEFNAQQYTPSRDFEVVCELDAAQSDVVVIPHQRGDDGYFLVQLSPPGVEGNWQRELLPDGKPLEILLVCDTSASMSSSDRKRQEQFVAAVLAALGPKDRFNLAVCDVDCHWKFEQSQPAEQANADDARQWLADRISLGWTDLDRTVASVLERVQEQTHVIYVGDGVVTSEKADPQGFVNRLKRLTADRKSGTFHAVSVGSRFESAVLRAVANVGGGSVRQIQGEQTPQQVAMELLNEVAQPGITDVEVEFQGLQVAAVYPKALPNLAAGTQQLIVGRYLPQGDKQSGRVLVRGKRNGESVQFAARISLEEAESGNSFIPRLWARARLDNLLEQGGSETIQQEIIGLSEEFHIITPYTSLLVLETDEDRERFGVQRRFQMRDGERYFADGRDSANLELLQQQMKRAADWRLELRRRTLANLAQLGRSTQQIEALRQQVRMNWSGMAPISGPISVSGAFDYNGYFEGGGEAGGVGGGSFGNGLGGELESLDGLITDSQANEVLEYAFEEDSASLERKKELYEADQPNHPFHPGLSDEFFARKRESPVAAKSRIGYDFKPLGQAYLGERLQRISHYQQAASVNWIATLLPPVPAVAARSQNEPDKRWPENAIALSERLNKPLVLNKQGLQISLETVNQDPRWKRISGKSGQFQLYSPQQWMTQSVAVGSHSLLQWCDGQRRGLYSPAFQLGRTRPSHPLDLENVSVGQRPFAPTPLHIAYSHYDPVIKELDGDLVEIVLTHESNDPGTEIRLRIDTQRGVVVQSESWSEGNLASTTKYADYVEVAGVWWPTRIDIFNGKGERTSQTRQSVKLLGTEQFQQQYQNRLPKPDVARIVTEPFPSLRKSRIATADGSARFDHHLTLLIEASLIQKWDEVLEHLDALKKIDAQRRGIRWIENAVWMAARRNNEALVSFQELAAEIVKGGWDDEMHLAEYLAEQVRMISDHNELLGVLDTLRPLYARQPEHLGALATWKGRRVAALEAADRHEEALAGQRELATDAPWQIFAHVRYAQALMKAGTPDLALAWLRQQLDRDVEWTEYEVDQVRSTYVDMLRELGRDQALVEFVTEWIETEPKNQYTYQKYLGALIFANQVEKADATARQWLKEGQIEGKLPRVPLARTRAAVNYAIGYRDNQHLNWLEPEWLAVLQQTARFYLQHEHHFEFAERILNDYRFQRADESDELQGTVGELLASSAETLEVDLLVAYARWTVNRTELQTADWEKIAPRIRRRWEAAEKEPRKALGGALVTIYASHFADSEYLPFLRERVARAVRDGDLNVVGLHLQTLFDALLERDWEAEQEIEAWALLPRLRDNNANGGRLLAQTANLHRWVDRMLEARYQAKMAELTNQGRPEKLTRTELRERQAEFRRSAREALAERLSAKLPADMLAETDKPSPELLVWMRMERAYLEVGLNKNLDEAAELCWKLLGETPMAAGERDRLAASVDPVERVEHNLNELLIQRARVTLANFAVRRSATEASRARLLKYVTAGTELDDESAAPYRRLKFALLVALDRPEPLENDLRRWIRDDEYAAPWQAALSRLQAERGEIQAAVQLLEAARRESQLKPADLRALADWHLLLDNRDAYRQARIDVYKMTEEWRIRDWIQRRKYRWTRSDQPLPSELDENVLYAFEALFQKSNQPGNYVDDLWQYYAACRDFRLLQMVPAAVVGHTPQELYPFLESLHSGLLVNVLQEATVDQMMERLRATRETCESELDRRALDLLEAMLERRASEVLNQPGPHEAAAVAALQRAFKRPWADGEVRQMAGLLDQLGTISSRPLAAERLRQLKALHQLTDAGSEDQLIVAWHVAHALFYSHEQRNEGIATMEAAIREYRQAHAEGWPLHLNSQFGGYVTLLETTHQFAAGERFLDRELTMAANSGVKIWLVHRRNQLWHAALREDGQVSLGTGKVLLENLVKRLLEQAESAVDDHLSDVLLEISEVLSTANRKQMMGHRELAEKFAFEQFPSLLKPLQNNYQHVVQQTSGMVYHVLGARNGLRFLIERFESYPKRLDYTWQSPWNQFGYNLANWRSEVGNDLGDLEPRLLKLVLGELRHELRTGYSRNHYFYYRNRSDFWKEKADDFAKTAEAVLVERAGRGRSILFVSRYLYEGLDLHKRALEVMLIAEGKDLLRFDAQRQLCVWLHERKRYAESIPILEPLVKRWPNGIEYRKLLITAYYRSSRDEQGDQLLAATDQRFRQQGLWTEFVISTLGECCVSNDRFAKAVGYYSELIPMHQRARADRGIGGGTLSNYYSQLALAYSGLGKTREAVDAAAGGVIAWGPRHDQRSTALSRLNHVLGKAKDLEEYVKFLDAQAAENGQDSPLIRSMIGKVFMERDQPRKAIAQFEAALELQPTRVETHEQLISAYQSIENKEAAVLQTLRLLDVDRHNLERYKQLAKELRSDEALAERAATTIVEAAPAEAAHHEALAVYRQEQNRWQDAILHWQQVAELRRLEPNGLVQLARAQVHQAQWDQARKTLERIQQTRWPERFSNVQQQLQELYRKIPEAK